MRFWLTALIVLNIMACSSGPKQSITSDTVVQNYFAAFNDHDANAMGRTMHEDIRLFSIDGDRLQLDAQGKATIVAMLHDYFAEFGDVLSTPESVQQLGTQFSVSERVNWTDAEGRARTQAALGIYVVEQGLITTVYYFSAQP